MMEKPRPRPPFCVLRLPLLPPRTLVVHDERSTRARLGSAERSEILANKTCGTTVLRFSVCRPLGRAN